ncbi:MAG: endonuclease MutS2, partial [Acutalibacteraceae bacterium]
MDRHERILELDKILELLAGQTNGPDAAQAARDLRPVPVLSEVKRLQDETGAAFTMMERFGSPSFGQLKNNNSAIRRAQAGAALSMRELLDVAATLRSIRSVTEWRAHCEGISSCLDDRFSVLAPNRYLEDKITASILSEEQMADEASSTLRDIRRKIRAASQRVREQLDHMIHSPAYQKFLQESIVTIRDGRFVVPVKAEHRADVPGLVHDSSGTGATLFVEPMGVVNANNDIKLLQGQEQAEIERILQALSAEVAQFGDAIAQDYEVLVELNLIFAKARLGYQMKGGMPTVTDDGIIRLKKARHPLIDPDKVVPIDVELGDRFDTLVITGPNTGGKTVTLKTVGLLTLMTMCGLMPPVSDGSTVSVFDRVLADIGDEQSIEQSLSTFSAHMTNLVKILKDASTGSLVLLDELGAGTDPVEGAALAIAILERLRQQDARIVATTHYAELKEYAVHTAGVENGSCEFDVATLRPTYRLLVGVPGRSNAFAISSRLGMDDALVERARSLVSAENRRMEDVVSQLEEQRQQLEQELADAQTARAQAQTAESDAKKRSDDLR